VTALLEYASMTALLECINLYTSFQELGLSKSFLEG